MSSFIQKFTGMDRRIIYVLISLAVIIPLLLPLGLPVGVTPEVKSVYDTIDSLPPRSVLFLAMDFDPASRPELYPMAEAILHHAFKKDLRVIGMTFWVTGTGLGEQVMVDVAKEYGKEYGKDYLYLGWKAGDFALVIGMGEKGFTATYPQDHYGRDTANMPVLENVKTLKDIGYLVELAAGNSLGTWYYYGKQKYKFKMGGGCTGVMAASWYNLMKIEWINGFLGGLRGAAEYEMLINRKSVAVRGMDPQSVAHMLIITLIVLSNIMYFATGGKSKIGAGK
ncbi:MAG: hypothetical protein V1701_04185 [Planctomycetota bacterium]